MVFGDFRIEYGRASVQHPTEVPHPEAALPSPGAVHAYQAVERVVELPLLPVGAQTRQHVPDGEVGATVSGGIGHDIGVGHRLSQSRMPVIGVPFTVGEDPDAGHAARGGVVGDFPDAESRRLLFHALVHVMDVVSVLCGLREESVVLEGELGISACGVLQPAEHAVVLGAQWCPVVVGVGREPQLVVGAGVVVSLGHLREHGRAEHQVFEVEGDVDVHQGDVVVALVMVQVTPVVGAHEVAPVGSIGAPIDQRMS